MGYLDELGEGLVDEDEGDEEGEDLLGEGRDVPNEEAALGRHHDQHDEHQPEADPHAPSQVLKLIGLAELGRGDKDTQGRLSVTQNQHNFLSN